MVREVFSFFLESAHRWRTQSFLQAAARIGKVVDALMLKAQNAVEKNGENSGALLVRFLDSVEACQGNWIVIISMMW